MKDLERLHFDNLYSTVQVQRYWGHLARNSRTAIKEAARQNDPLKALALLGASLHAVQDFYTHSNWVETHARGGGGYRTETFFGSPPGLGLDLYTGYYPNDKPAGQGREPHGTYTSGMNHDSYVRPRWDEAYVFAYAASRQWTAAMGNWAEAENPGFWSRVKTFGVAGQDAADLKTDLNAAYRISEWIATPGKTGTGRGVKAGVFPNLCRSRRLGQGATTRCSWTPRRRTFRGLRSVSCPGVGACR